MVYLRAEPAKTNGKPHFYLYGDIREISLLDLWKRAYVYSVTPWYILNNIPKINAISWLL